jgi:hypothetical protein
MQERPEKGTKAARMGKTHISTRTQEEQTNENQKDIENESAPAANTPFHEEPWTMISTAHANIRDAPEDKTEEGIEQGAHDRQEGREEGDDFRDNPSCDPEHG